MLDRTADPTEAGTTLISASMAGVSVRSSDIHGRGVFADKRFRKGDVIEVCPVIVILPEQVTHLEQTELWGYYYEWNNGGGVAIAQGFGSLYNHSWAPNAQYEQDYEAGTITITAVRTIAAGHEITINYTGAPDGRAELWFEADPPPEADPTPAE